MEREYKDFAKDLLVSLSRLKRDGKFSDFMLKVGGEEIPVHRNILSAASPYFEAMLSSEAIEKKRGWAEIFDLDPDAVKTCINFIYSGKAKLSLENPELLIQASDLMQIPQLKELYFEFLMDKVAIETCHCYLDLAAKYHADTFVKRLQDYVLRNIATILDSESISQRTEYRLREAMDLLPANFPNREIRKWKAIETWVKADVENRRDKFLNLFKVILLDKIPLECLTKDILVSDLVKNSDNSRDAILSSLSTVSERPLRQIVHTPLAINDPLPPYTKIPTQIVALNSESRMLHTMNFSTYKWSRFARIPFGCKDMLSFRGDLYLRTFDYDLVRYSGGEWEKLCKLDRKLLHCKWLASDDIICFIEENSIRKYHPFTNSWTVLSSKLDNFYRYTFAILKDRIMLLSTVSSNTAMEFNLNLEQWECISRFKEGPIIYPVLCVIDDKFFVLGKDRYLGEVCVSYNPDTDNWIKTELVAWNESVFGKMSTVISTSCNRVCIIGTERGVVYFGRPPLRFLGSFEVSSNLSSLCLM